MKYRKKPVVIQAERIPDLFEIDERINFENWIADTTMMNCVWRGNGLVVRTLEGEMIGNPNDMLIIGVKGELYPCKSDIFELTYELVE